MAFGFAAGFFGFAAGVLGRLLRISVFSLWRRRAAPSYFENIVERRCAGAHHADLYFARLLRLRFEIDDQWQLTFGNQRDLTRLLVLDIHPRAKQFLVMVSDF